MLLCLGLDTQFAMVETLMAALHDIPQAATPPPYTPYAPYTSLHTLTPVHPLHSLTLPCTPCTPYNTPLTPPHTPSQITLRKERLSALLCLLMLACGVIFVTEQGVHWLEVSSE